ncbi:tRNA threonylcarbamoyladenosine dehydratase [Desulfoscipio gibsoniae]|uniref:Dinucleotide-utilizing enzyme possibly involved in molybdopterin or thiamin biosynthesis n=1 Tax=Desulfoscipio gibsoniae DSM 7213 TaxID=767817 RepID=R4KNI1_9FIRM|nr:tRNA threonylcarbamoyladenosine dehydratase [Desulfoscipio gibsoniae]AGL02095.1 dinucleotide-utilizing enzyme possibly involved in molybdopterin or thiamin biosynthesis [Desulfoscipio gibsoniae DSM 7213]
MSHRFARTELLIGSTGLEKLAACKVAVFGLGGVGSFTAEALARSGVGSLFLVDHDTVDITNINRQLHALSDTVGLPKTQVMKERLLQVNPALQIQTRQQKFTPELTADMLDNRDLDFVVDTIDDVDNKAALIAGCVKRNMPVISAMGAGNKLDPTSFKIDSIWKTSVCPLARVMRKKLRAIGITADVPVVYSTARPISPLADTNAHTVSTRYTPATGSSVPAAHGFCISGPPGSIAYVPSVAGLIMAAFVTDKLLGLDVFPVV